MAAINTTNTNIMSTKCYSQSSKLLISLLLIVPCSYAYMSVKDNLYDRFVSPYIFTALFVWSTIEFVFYFYFLYSRNRLQKTTKPKDPLKDQLARANLFWNCVHTIHDLPRWSEGWFYYKLDYSHPKFEEVQRENMALWFAWAFWHEHLEIVRKNPQWAEEIEWMLLSAEDWFQVKFPAGQNYNLECIRLNLDPVQAYYRPLILYVGIYASTSLFNIVYLQLYLGFEHCGSISPGILWGSLIGYFHHLLDREEQTRVLSYYYRPALSAHNNKKTPLIFIHGIGAGVICYAELLNRICLIDRPVFLVELPYISMHMVDTVPSAKDTVLEISNMLNRFDHRNGIFISHSMGTGVSSWIMNISPDLIGGVVMIDPICFLLHYHHVAFNFVHRIPRKAIQYVMHYFAARELYISHFISRHFQWYETIYFSPPSVDEKSPLRNATVFLSEKDGIVGSPRVYKYLLERKVDVRLMEGLEHAMFLISKKWKNTILYQINIIAKKADKNNNL